MKKSDGVRIRLIIDAWRGNARFRDPPGISLATSEAFARFELEHHIANPDTEAGIDTPVLSVGLSDVKDCFHRMVQPKWLREYFCLDPVPAHWLGLGGTLLGDHRLRDDDLIFPIPAPLCVGFSWSLYYTQKVNQHLMSRIPTLACSRLFSDRSEPVVIKSGRSEAQPSHHFVYVDNLGILSTACALNHAFSQVTKVFYDHHLNLRPGEVKHEAVDTLGCRVDGVKHVTTLKPSRAHKVRQALRGLLQRGKCSGRLLENIVGHLTYSFLMARPLLSIFDRVYKFIKRHYDAKAVLWSSVRDELIAALGGIIFCQADWNRGWNKLVSASDASLEGYGLCYLLVPPVRLAAEWTLLLSPEHLERPGKTGEYDLSVALDSSCLKPWWKTVFELLRKQRASTPLWDFNYGDFVTEFHKACKALSLDLSPYQMRHSGPSIDRANNWRTALEVQKRGGWKSARSIQEVSPPRSRLPRATPQTSTSLPMVRRPSRGCHPQKARSVGASLTKHHGCYFLDLFSGKGGVRRGFRKLGFRVLSLTSSMDRLST